MRAEATTKEVGSALPWRRMLQRPGQLLALILAGMFVLAVGVLGGMTWRNLSRLEQLRANVEYSVRLQEASLQLEHAFVQGEAVPDSARPEVLDALRGALATIHDRPLRLGPSTEERLSTLEALLTRPEDLSPGSVASAVDSMRGVIEAEARAQQHLLRRLAGATRGELDLAIAAFAALPLLGLLGYWILRQRILKPLDDLRGVLSQLANGQFNAVSTEGVYPLLVPLFQNYNYLVTRLEELESEHRLRARSLESEVRAATKALLEQQRSLARAERMAAVGELAAGLAHELRNPLAGILMSLGNLRREFTDADLIERLDLVISEIERLTRMLNQYLSNARHHPEPTRPVALASLVADLIALLRYQVPKHIQLEAAVPQDLTCLLPRDRIRQALLNLILNAAHALGDESGSVRVSAAREDRWLVLSVCDDGPGFPPEMLESGVLPFATRNEAGTGLGMAMVRRVVLDLGGDLQIENVQPRGACVRLSLPYHRG
jgi:signal transduction histidine kinase